MHNIWLQHNLHEKKITFDGPWKDASNLALEEDK